MKADNVSFSNDYGSKICHTQIHEKSEIKKNFIVWIKRNKRYHPVDRCCLESNSISYVEVKIQQLLNGTDLAKQEVRSN